MAALPARGLSSERSQKKPEVLSFEKDLSYELASLKKLSGKREDHVLRQRLSNGLFQLWNKYERKMQPQYLAEKLLSTGDSLYRAKEYRLASVHCYGRYLRVLSKASEGDVVDDKASVNVGQSYPLTWSDSFALRAAIGDAASRYHTAVDDDPHFRRSQTKSQALSTLRSLQHCSQISLQTEQHYWLTYNCVLLTYAISRTLIAAGHTAEAVEYILWAAVCLESSVPLLAVKYLRLRVDVYTAVCQCYYFVREPYQAELFARRGLERAHELAVLEHQASSKATEASERVFREATLKLSVMVFRRSVLESRLTKKGMFRPKKRPSIRELLQQPFPRSPTEKLVSELFVGEAAQLLAVLEALLEPSRGSLVKGLPQPITNLDGETTADVIQELLCGGTDLVLRSLQRHESGEGETTPTISLLEAAIDEMDCIPLASVLHYVRMAFSYEQREIVELLSDRVTALAEGSSEAGVHRQLVSLRLLQLVDAVRALAGRRVNLSAVESHNALSQEPGDKLVQLSTSLHSACRDPALLEPEQDLLQDSVLYLWETISPVFSHIHSHHPHTTRPLATSRRGKEYTGILEQLVDMTRCLQLWRTHPLLCGELVLKLACLSEAGATSPPTTQRGEGALAAVLYDRAELLKTLAYLEEGLGWVCLAREESDMESGAGHLESGAECQHDIKPLALLHSELCYVNTRVRVKLAATVPPPATPEPTLKPSSLQKKVLERREKEEQCHALLSSLSAHDTPVPPLSQLRAECRSNHYHKALLSMLEAVFTPRLTQGRKTALMQEAVSLLQQLDQELPVPPCPLLPPWTPLHPLLCSFIAHTPQ